jgi:hypothetical protein
VVTPLTGPAGFEAPDWQDDSQAVLRQTYPSNRTFTRSQVSPSPDRERFREPRVATQGEDDGSRPFLRTLAALAGSSVAFYYVQDLAEGEPDDLLTPIAGGVVGGAFGAMLFTNANPILVLLGSAVAALPGAALSTYLAGMTDDADQNRYIPLAAFSVPHGLLTSALAKHRRR